MGYFGFATDLKATRGLLRNLVALGHAPVQPQMFEPGVRQKSLYEAAIVGRVLENAPQSYAPASAALARVLSERV